MPIAEHSIDGLQFLTLRGDVAERQEDLEAFSRGGVDGWGFRRLGKRGEPFELVSFVDMPSLEDAQAAYEDYLTRTATNPVPLIKDGLSWGTYMVKRVTLMPSGIRAVASFAGGINAPSLALLSCRWILMG